MEKNFERDRAKLEELLSDDSSISESSRQEQLTTLMVKYQREYYCYGGHLVKYKPSMWGLFNPFRVHNDLVKLHSLLPENPKYAYEQSNLEQWCYENILKKPSVMNELLNLPWEHSGPLLTMLAKAFPYGMLVYDLTEHLELHRLMESQMKKEKQQQEKCGYYSFEITDDIHPSAAHLISLCTRGLLDLTCRTTSKTTSTALATFLIAMRFSDKSVMKNLSLLLDEDDGPDDLCTANPNVALALPKALTVHGKTLTSFSIDFPLGLTDIVWVKSLAHGLSVMQHLIDLTIGICISCRSHQNLDDYARTLENQASQELFDTIEAHLVNTCTELSEVQLQTDLVKLRQAFLRACTRMENLNKLQISNGGYHQNQHPHDSIVYLYYPQDHEIFMYSDECLPASCDELASCNITQNIKDLTTEFEITPIDLTKFKSLQKFSLHQKLEKLTTADIVQSQMFQHPNLQEVTFPNLRGLKLRYGSPGYADKVDFAEISKLLGRNSTLIRFPLFQFKKGPPKGTTAIHYLMDRLKGDTNLIDIGEPDLSHLDEDEKQSWMHILYLLNLNSFGRKEARNPSTPLFQFVQILAKANQQDTEETRELTDKEMTIHAGSVNKKYLRFKLGGLCYGLLREMPSKWCRSELQTALQGRTSNQERKRGREQYEMEG